MTGAPAPKAEPTKRPGQGKETASHAMTYIYTYGRFYFCFLDQFGPCLSARMKLHMELHMEPHMELHMELHMEHMELHVELHVEQHMELHIEFHMELHM